MRTFRIHGFLIIVMCLVCVGTGIVCKREMNKRTLRPGQTYSDCRNMKIRLGEHDLWNPSTEVYDVWMKNLKEFRTKKGLNHVYDDYDNVGVFQVVDDFKLGPTFSEGRLKLIKNIKSKYDISEGELLKVFYNSSFYIDEKDRDVYNSSDLGCVPQKGEYYLFVYNRTLGQKLKAALERSGVDLPEYYTIDGAPNDSNYLRLSKEQNLNTTEADKIYTLDELKGYDFFSSDRKFLEEWYKTKDAILKHYVGEKYWEIGEE